MTRCGALGSGVAMALAVFAAAAGCRTELASPTGLLGDADGGTEPMADEDASDAAETGEDAAWRCPDAGAQFVPSDPDGAPSGFPACDPSTANQSCQVGEEILTCLDGQWLVCSTAFCNRACNPDASLPPEGSPCCPEDYTAVQPGSGCGIATGDGCCSGGRFASCLAHHLKYGDPCVAIDAGDRDAPDDVADGAAEVTDSASE